MRTRPATSTIAGQFCVCADAFNPTMLIAAVSTMTIPAPKRPAAGPERDDACHVVAENEVKQRDGTGDHRRARLRVE